MPSTLTLPHHFLACVSGYTLDGRKKMAKKQLEKNPLDECSARTLKISPNCPTSGTVFPKLIFRHIVISVLSSCQLPTVNPSHANSLWFGYSSLFARCHFAIKCLPHPRYFHLSLFYFLEFIPISFYVIFPFVSCSSLSNLFYFSSFLSFPEFLSFQIS